MKTLEEATVAKIEEGKEEFEFYLNELGYDIAKQIMVESTCLKAVIAYIENYPKSKDVK